MQRLLAELSRLGVRLRVEGEELRITAPPGALTEQLRQELRTHKKSLVEMLGASRAASDAALPTVTADLANLHAPFPLTEIQHAYWLGRDGAIEMGNVATHLYLELDSKDLDLARCEESLNACILRHGMLRAVVTPDGMQRILPEVPRYRIQTEDRSGASREEAEAAVRTTRQALSHQVLEPGRWPLFDIRATRMPGAQTRLHVSLDLLILDAFSIFLFFREWHRVYQDPAAAPSAPDISFRDYVLAEKSMAGSDAHQRAEKYWMSRIDTIPAAPDLPLKADLSVRKAPRFYRHEARVEAARWERLEAAARTRGLTPSGLLVSIYSEVLARWSATPHFTLNVTVSNRLQMHRQVNDLLGDFTSLSMLEVDRRDPNLSFLEFARATQRRFLDDLAHNQVSGMKVMQEWNKRNGVRLEASMPVVFSSGLIWTGGDDVGDLEQFGKKVFSVSHTSQVWLDHHVMELKGDLVLIWDAADGVFEEGVIEAMFETYRRTVERFASDADDALWDRRDVVAIPEEMEGRRVEANRTARPVPEGRLHAEFVARARQAPRAPAIFAPSRTLTYGDLLSESAAVADWLLQAGARPGHPVAIVMHKGWEQIVAVQGVMLAGAAYLPIDADLPQRRLAELLEIGQVSQVLTQPGTRRDVFSGAGYQVLEIQPGARAELGPAHQRSLDADPGELAYVIFTSGTTGVPKGVMIDHRAALNTVQAINEMFAVRPRDRVLAVSSLSFDLSVYDIFGILGAGGALVLPDFQKEHDPFHWRERMEECGVTVWNSAPQLMRMLLDSFAEAEVGPGALRTVMLSGDFIPLDAPDRIRRRWPSAQITSLGGATEASIWSNYYRVGAVDPTWTSIPYGRPLPNQTMTVFDSGFRPCPDWAKGRIFIGGIGLATGYWGDPEKTAARFVKHPVSGERLYDTGDLGRYGPDGNIFILGRADSQLKIRGFRVELGEIESVLRRSPQIDQVAVLVTPGSPDERRLVAFVTAALDSDAARSGATPIDAQGVKDFLRERLPGYIVPQQVVVLDQLPLSANGKIDQRALAALLDEATGQEQRADVIGPRTEVEEALLAVWSRVMAGAEIGVTDNFFELGGDSVLATQLVREINAALPAFQLQMHELFENLTVEALAALFEARAAGGEATTGRPEPSASGGGLAQPEVLLADVRAAEERFQSLQLGAPCHAGAPHAVLLTGATGWVGAHLLRELLASTEAKVVCLVRNRDRRAAHDALLDNLRDRGMEVEDSWAERVAPLIGDLTRPQLGLGPNEWRGLSEEVDLVYHWAASVNVLWDYNTHRAMNVQPLSTLVELAAAHHVKPILFGSPMTVCRRLLDGALTVLTEEAVHDDPRGLLTGYAQSKWVGEHVLTAAAKRGVPVKIYRTSHALPSSKTGLAKTGDTYGAILGVACRAEAIPEWRDSAIQGLPVDTYCRLIVTDSLSQDGFQGVIHLENPAPPSLDRVMEALLGEKLQGRPAPRVSLREWAERCRQVADQVPGEVGSLGKLLFTERDAGTAVEAMFARHAHQARRLEETGRGAALVDATPPAYWQRVWQTAQW